MARDKKHGGPSEEPIDQAAPDVKAGKSGKRGRPGDTLAGSLKRLANRFPPKKGAIGHGGKQLIPLKRK